MNTIRLNHHAENIDDVWQYYITRARQFLYHNISWNRKLKPEPFGWSTKFYKDGQEFHSGYVTVSKRGSGLYKDFLDGKTIITANSCKLEGYFKKIGYTSYFLPPIPEDWPEYQLIEQSYGDQKSNRSQVYLMNHIDEALAVMQKNKASIASQKAFCLHPLLQDDNDIIKNYQKILPTIEPHILILAMEYRHIANAYLSHRQINTLEDIKLSVLPEVQEMLKGDKPQNYKDFLLYHQEHPRHPELVQYFENWCQKLNCRSDVDWLLEKETMLHPILQNKLKL